MMKYSIILPLLAVTLSACKEKTAPAQKMETMETSGDLPAGFQDFYQKFLTDSLYQIAHITWPLQGLKTIQVDSVTPETKDTEWTLNEWRMHRMDLIKSGDYKQKFQTIGDFMVIEQVIARSQPYGIERRFSKQASNEWELIYYAATHEIR